MFFGLNDVAFLGSLQPPVLWTPADITTALWLDAADASTITESSNAVSQWDDKSGNGRHVSQANAGSRPVFAPTGLNGKQTIDFDGNDFLKNASFQPAGALSCFIVFNRDTAGGILINAQRTNGIFEIAGSSGANYKNVTITATGAMNPALGFDIANGGTNQDIILGIQYDGSGSASTDFVARLNGADQAITNSGAVGFLSETGFTVGARAVQGLNYYNGRISELVYISSQASLSDVEKLEGYLAHKWNLTANLPNDHPYKTAAPTV